MPFSQMKLKLRTLNTLKIEKMGNFMAKQLKKEDKLMEENQMYLVYFS